MCLNPAALSIECCAERLNPGVCMGYGKQIIPLGVHNVSCDSPNEHSTIELAYVYFHWRVTWSRYNGTTVTNYGLGIN